MVLIFVTEELQTALHQNRCAGDERAVPGSFDEAAELQHAVEVLLGPLPRFNLGHEPSEVVCAHSTRRTLTAALILEKI